MNANAARRADKQQLDNKFNISAGKSMGRHTGFVYSQRKQMSDHMDTINLSTVCCVVVVSGVLEKYSMFYMLLFSRSFIHFDLDFFLESLQRKLVFLFDPDGILFLQNLCDIRFCYVHPVFFSLLLRSNLLKV